jgi:TRAP-type C4-dicarboxylate transport system permease small subunit
MRFYVFIEEIISKILICAVVSLVFTAACGRWLGVPMPLAVDLAQLLFIWVCFLGTNQALRRNQHLGVEMFHDRLPGSVQNMLAIVFCALSIGFLCFLLIKGIELTRLNTERTFSDSQLSYSLVTAAVPVGSALLIWTFLRKIFLQLAGRPDPYVVTKNPGEAT